MGSSYVCKPLLIIQSISNCYFNSLQIDGNITDVMNPTPIDEKFKAFGWNVLTVDGHDIDALLDCYEEAKNFKERLL